MAHESGWLQLLPGVVAAALIFTSLWTDTPPLESGRTNRSVELPSDKQSGPSTLPAFAARLWQDPFQAVAQSSKHHTRAEGWWPPLLSPGYKDNTANARQELAKNDPFVLVATVPSGGYPEDSEVRITTRVAVLSALAMNGYQPVDSERIEVIYDANRRQIPMDRLTRDNATSGRSVRNGAPTVKLPETICVLWVGEQYLASRPLAAFAAILNNLALRNNVNVLGPYSSTILKDMLNEVPQIQNDANSSCLDGVRFWSWGATADLHLLRQGVPLELSQEPPDIRDSVSKTDAATREVHDPKKKYVVRQDDSRASRLEIPIAKQGDKLTRIFLMRPSADDEDLAWALVQEVGRRRAEGKHRGIVIISEHDTFYGRALGTTFERLASGSADHANIGLQLLSLKYFRGVDGQLYVGETPPRSPRTSDAKPDAGSLDRASEKAEGVVQADYIRRAVAQIQDWERGLADADAEFDAIGVLGSDLYDKAMIVQALRARFPDKIFFTTDLDARMLHPGIVRYTRNMIVSSAFGQSVRLPWQNLIKQSGIGHIQHEDQVAPFRNSYQTAAYFLCDRAVNEWKSDKPSVGAVDPLLFEVGQTRFHLLGISHRHDDEGATPDSHPHLHWRERPAWVPVTPGVVLRVALLFAGAIIALPLMLPVFRQTLLDRFSIPERDRKGLQIFIAVSFLALFAWMAVVGWQSVSEDGEPFAWFDGVSIWPSELLRLIAFLTSIGAIWMCKLRIRGAIPRIQREFFGEELPRPPALRPAPKRRPMTWGYRYRRLKHRLMLTNFFYRSHRLHSAYEPPLNPVTKWRLLKTVLRHGATGRVLTFLTVILLIGFALIGKPAPAPARGQFARTIDTVLLCASVLAFLFLLFTVVDVFRITTQFIRELARSDSNWPVKAMKNAFPCVPWKQNDHSSNRQENQARCDALAELADMRLIERLTSTVESLLYYPFIVLAFLLVARSDHFDRWPWPLGLLLIFAINTALVLWSAIMLRHSAQSARQDELQKLEKKLIAAEAGANNSSVAIMRTAAEQIKRLESGAFSPLSQHPIVGSIVVLLGLVSTDPLAQLLHKLIGNG